MSEKTVEKTIQIAMLYDFYGELLTPRQKEVLQYYYEENYSLSEKALRGYEQKLGLVERFKRTEADTQKAVEELDQIIGYLTDGSGAERAVFDNKMIEKLKNVKNILSTLEEE